MNVQDIIDGKNVRELKMDNSSIIKEPSVKSLFNYILESKNVLNITREKKIIDQMNFDNLINKYNKDNSNYNTNDINLDHTIDDYKNDINIDYKMNDVNLDYNMNDVNLDQGIIDLIKQIECNDILHVLNKYNREDERYIKDDNVVQIIDKSLEVEIDSKSKTGYDISLSINIKIPKLILDSCRILKISNFFPFECSLYSKSMQLFRFSASYNLQNDSNTVKNGKNKLRKGKNENSDNLKNDLYVFNIELFLNYNILDYKSYVLKFNKSDQINFSRDELMKYIKFCKSILIRKENFKEDVKGNIKESLKKSTKENLKKILKQNLKKSTKEILKENVKQNLKQNLKKKENSKGKRDILVEIVESKQENSKIDINLKLTHIFDKFSFSKVPRYLNIKVNLENILYFERNKVFLGIENLNLNIQKKILLKYNYNVIQPYEQKKLKINQSSILEHYSKALERIIEKEHNNNFKRVFKNKYKSEFENKEMSKAIIYKINTN